MHVYKWKQSKTALDKMSVDFEGQKQWSKVKTWICFLQTCSFSLHKTLIVGLECIIVMLLSAVWTLSNVNATFLQICSDEETNTSISWMAWEWVHFQQIYISGWTVPLNSQGLIEIWVVSE